MMASTSASALVCASGDVIGARMLPGMPRDKGLLQSLVDREHEAQATYAGFEPVLHHLAPMALVALVVIGLVALALYFAGHLRHASRIARNRTQNRVKGWT